MVRSKKMGGNCIDLLSAIIPLKNIDINADVNKLISSRACDELVANLSNRANSVVLQDKSSSLGIDKTEPVDYLYINSRGGCKKMAKGKSENIVCNSCMKGGCFTCDKGKKKMNAVYKEVVAVIPALYIKYKEFDKKKKENKMKGGYGSFMENIMNVSNLSFKYKEFEPINFGNQLQDI